MEREGGDKSLALAWSTVILKETPRNLGFVLIAMRTADVQPQYLVFVVAVVSYTLLAAIWDFRTRKVPNALTVTMFLSGVVFRTVTGGFGTAGLLDSLGGFAVGFGTLLLLWLVGGGGAGDVKLMGGLGAWLGTWDTLWVFLFSAGFVVLGSAGVLGYQMLRHGSGYVRQRYVASPTRGGKKRTLGEEAQREWRQRRRIMAFAFPVALGTWLVLALHWKQFMGA